MRSLLRYCQTKPEPPANTHSSPRRTALDMSKPGQLSIELGNHAHGFADCPSALDKTCIYRKQCEQASSNKVIIATQARGGLLAWVVSSSKVTIIDEDCVNAARPTVVFSLVKVKESSRLLAVGCRSQSRQRGRLSKELRQSHRRYSGWHEQRSGWSWLLQSN